MPQTRSRSRSQSTASEITLEQLHEIFSDRQLLNAAKDDFFRILRTIGYAQMAAHLRVDAFVEGVCQAGSLEKLESECHAVFKQKTKQIKENLTGRFDFERTLMGNYFCNRILKTPTPGNGVH